jgi:hypothetical protein
MKIVGYCALWAIAIALLIAMCAILRDSVITHDLSIRGHAADSEMHAAEGAINPTTSAKQP